MQTLTRITLFIRRFENRRLLPLMVTAAENLVGRSVLVFLQVPTIRNFSGMAYRHKGGALAIDIDPALPVDELLKLFLHEVGHHFYGHLDDAAPMDYSEFSFELARKVEARKFRIDQTAAEIEEHDKDPKELAADDFSSELGAYAGWKSKEIFGVSSVKARLHVLSMVSILRSPEDKA